MIRKLIRYIARREINALRSQVDAMRAEGYTLGGLDGYNRGHDDARSEVSVELGAAYLAGVTDGVYLALQEPGHMPKMTNKPEESLVTQRKFFEAIDNADRLRRIPRAR